MPASQLVSLDVERLLADGECVVLAGSADAVDGGTTLQFYVAPELVDDDDPHLGYTQIVRLVEAARYLEFDRLCGLASLPDLDCTLRAMEMQCHGPLERHSTALISARSNVRAGARTAFSMRFAVHRVDNPEPLLTAEMVLVMIDDVGRSVTLPPAFREAIGASIHA